MRLCAKHFDGQAVLHPWVGARTRDGKLLFRSTDCPPLAETQITRPRDVGRETANRRTTCRATISGYLQRAARRRAMSAAFVSWLSRRTHGVDHEHRFAERHRAIPISDPGGQIMTVSVFDLFSVGIGPSSSHTVGPMRAAARFADDLADEGLLGEVAAVRVDLYGSLAATGGGHGTMPAILFGLEGERPELLDPDDMAKRLAQMRSTGVIHLGGTTAIHLTESDIALHPEIVLDRPPQRHHAARRLDATGANIATETYFSVGGGFVVGDDDPGTAAFAPSAPPPMRRSARRGSCCELAAARGVAISDVMAEFEVGLRPADEVRSNLLHISRRDGRVRPARYRARTASYPETCRCGGAHTAGTERLNTDDPDRDPAFADGLGDPVLRPCGERGERCVRPRCHRPDQRRCWRDPGRIVVRPLLFTDMTQTSRLRTSC